ADHPIAVLTPCRGLSCGASSRRRRQRTGTVRAQRHLVSAACSIHLAADSSLRSKGPIPTEVQRHCLAREPGQSIVCRLAAQPVLTTRVATPACCNGLQLACP